MSTGKERLDDEDLDELDDSVPTPSPEPVAKINLAKRRTIDNLREEKRLKRQLSDYDYDL